MVFPCKMHFLGRSRFLKGGMKKQKRKASTSYFEGGKTTRMVRSRRRCTAAAWKTSHGSGGHAHFISVPIHGPFRRRRKSTPQYEPRMNLEKPTSPPSAFVRRCPIHPTEWRGVRTRVQFGGRMPRWKFGHDISFNYSLLHFHFFTGSGMHRISPFVRVHRLGFWIGDHSLPARTTFFSFQ